ncbi:hypothetical protein P154DRAFT_533950 [Amniculicola lignicola CBS 123094]|uniref:Uncharacterized protein n=1 Tax=Amniculicola lignicola CBS 123094 TaxID=1392246 RepID=A0A6A5WML9_9PLEO|nr:hypothetical protein P154DRAFT_533950 [Amniculicola lignicola CBS 123094]
MCGRHGSHGIGHGAQVSSCSQQRRGCCVAGLCPHHQVPGWLHYWLHQYSTPCSACHGCQSPAAASETDRVCAVVLDSRQTPKSSVSAQRQTSKQPADGFDARVNTCNKQFSTAIKSSPCATRNLLLPSYVLEPDSHRLSSRITASRYRRRLQLVALLRETGGPSIALGTYRQTIADSSQQTERPLGVSCSNMMHELSQSKDQVE